MHGKKITALWTYLNRERVGNVLIFTAEHAKEVATQVGTSKNRIWGMLHRLQKYGFITRRRRKKGGIIINFDVIKASKDKVEPKGRPSGKHSPKERELTVNQLRERLRMEIASLERRLADKRTLYAQIVRVVRR